MEASSRFTTAPFTVLAVVTFAEQRFGEVHALWSHLANQASSLIIYHVQEDSTKIIILTEYKGVKDKAQLMSTVDSLQALSQIQKTAKNDDQGSLHIICSIRHNLHT